MAVRRKIPKRGVTAGAFDLCHAGHMLMFKEAKKKCQHLTVFLQEDPSLDRPDKNKPIMSLAERKIILESVQYIDAVRVYKTEADLYKLLKKYKPDIRIIGADWKGKPFTGHDLQIPLYFNKRGHAFSSTELRARVAAAEGKQKITVYR